MTVRVAPAIGRVTWSAVVTAALWRFGEVLPAPPVQSLGAVEAWYTGAGVAVALVSVARLGALLVSALLLALAATAVAELVVVGMTHRCVDRLAPGALRRLARAMVGLSLTAGLTSVPSVSARPTEGEPGAAALRGAGERGSGTATMRRLDEPTPLAPAATPLPAVPPSPPSPPPGAESVVVAHGDSFWSIAEEVVTDRGGPSDDRSVTKYWEALVAANRANLIDPGNPDLIHPGQRLTLPAR